MILHLLNEGWTPRQPYQFIDSGIVIVNRDRPGYLRREGAANDDRHRQRPEDTLPGTAQMKPSFELRRISKSFPGVKALTDVSLSFLPGEIHAVMGENGAGKSTLMKIATGIYQPDEGEIFLDGRPVSFRAYRDSIARGVYLVHQEIQVVPESTIAENVMLDKLITKRGTGIIDWPAVNARAQEYADMVGLNLPATTLVRNLSGAQKQLIQIAKALAAQAQVLLLDEPTSTLSEHEALRLQELLRALKGQGKTLIYISHKLEEILALCDRGQRPARRPSHRHQADERTGPRRHRANDDRPGFAHGAAGRPAHRRTARNAARAKSDERGESRGRQFYPPFR